MFLHRSPKTALKNTQNSPLAFWSWHSQKFWKMKVFIFLDFLEIVFKKISIWHVGLLEMFPCQSSKTALKNTQNYLFLQHFEVDILENFQKWNFLFFLTFSKFFFPTYAWIPQIASQITETFWNQLVRLLKNCNEILENGKSCVLLSNFFCKILEYRETLE